MDSYKARTTRPHVGHYCFIYQLYKIESSTAILPMASEERWETTMQVMQIIPDNQIAKTLFRKCYKHVKDSYHGKFMVKLPMAEGDILDDEPIESDTEYDSPPRANLDEQLYDGYYNISLAAELKPEMNIQLGWRIGKGHSRGTDEHRMVDIILAKPGDPLSKTLPSLVCRLYLDKQLGILMAHRPDRSKGDIEIKIDNNSWENFGLGEDKPLYRTSSWLRAGRCDYELRYTVNPSQREQLLAQRDQILGVKDDFNIQTPQNATEVEITLPRLPVLTYVPGDAMWTNSRYVRLGTIGSGGFGYIREGFNINTCRRIAIKELRLQKNYDCELLLNELDIMRKLQVSKSSTFSAISS